MKVIVVLPAYNAAKTLEKTIADLPKGAYDDLLLVDDASNDETVEVAKKLGLKVYAHPQNLGYGGNQKTCYREALKLGADIVAMVHPDYQYDPRVVPYMVGLIKDGICDIVLGNRIRSRAEALSGGMPLYKYFANRFLTIVENFFLGQNMGEFHSGLRAFNRKSLEKINWQDNSNDFIFDQEILIQAVYFGFRIGDIPVPTKYFDEASSISFVRSVKYGLLTLLTLMKFFFHKKGIIKFKMFSPASAEKSRR